MLMAGGYNKNVIRTVVQKQNLDKKMDSQRVNSVQQETNYLLYTHFDVFPVNKTILVKFFRAISRVVWFCFRRHVDNIDICNANLST